MVNVELCQQTDNILDMATRQGVSIPKAASKGATENGIKRSGKRAGLQDTRHDNEQSQSRTIPKQIHSWLWIIIAKSLGISLQLKDEPGTLSSIFQFLTTSSALRKIARYKNSFSISFIKCKY